MNFKPNVGKVLIKKYSDAKTESGIILTDQKHPIKGTVEAVGEGVKNYKEGDVVYFIKYAGTDIKDDYVVMSKDDILGLTW